MTTCGVVQAPLTNRLTTTSKPDAELRDHAAAYQPPAGSARIDGSPSPLASPSGLRTTLAEPTGLMRCQALATGSGSSPMICIFPMPSVAAGFGDHVALTSARETP